MTTRHRATPPALAVTYVDEDFAVFEWTAADPAPRPALTPAEDAVLAAIVRGDSNAAIAAARQTSVRTVANQVAALLRKLGASSRYDLIRRHGANRG
ncbi:MAG: helix-turn-helix transcriptional regulator [Myxococcales bacterium]|nr:helix-turn-helix transcriptional regulator [Myxococcales bacterium]